MKFDTLDVLFLYFIVQAVASSQQMLCSNWFWFLVTCLAGAISMRTSNADLMSAPPLR